MKSFFLDIEDESVKQHQEKVIDWTVMMEEIDRFWRYELRELINYGGRKILIRTLEGVDIPGILTGVHQDFVQLNGSIRIFLDDIQSIIVSDIKNDNPNSTNKR